MPLPIRDGNQSLTTLSTILVSNSHIPAHTVVSLGTQAITDMRGAVSGSVVSISNFPSSQVISGTITVGNSVTIGSLPAISGTITIGNSITIGASSVTLTSYVAKNQTGQWNALSTDVGSGYLFTIANITTGSSQIGSVTASGTVTANIGGIANSVTLPVRLFAEKLGEAPSGQDTLLVCNSSGMLLVDANSGGSSVLGYDGNAFVQVKQVSGSSVTVGNPVTVGAIVGPLGGSVFKGNSPSSDSIRVLPIFSQNGAANYNELSTSNPFPIAGTVTLGASTAQIGSVTVGNSVTIGSLPAISGTVTANLGNVAQSIGFLSYSTTMPSSAVRIGWGDEEHFNSAGCDAYGKPLPVQILLGNSIGDSVATENPLPISGTVTANTFALQGTAVTTSNFTSTTASTVLANYNATREVLTIFNEGAGNLHICAGATCTTIAYQVRLSAGDYYEVPNHQTTITHSAVFATAGTARVCQVS
jgi:predicted acyltransferase (DUF342 family)